MRTLRPKFLRNFEEKNFQSHDLPGSLGKSFLLFQMFSFPYVLVGSVVHFADWLGKSYPGWHFPTKFGFLCLLCSLFSSLGPGNFPLLNLSLKVRMWHFTFLLFVVPDGYSSHITVPGLEWRCVRAALGDHLKFSELCHMQRNALISAVPALFCLFKFLCFFFRFSNTKHPLHAILMFLSTSY